jgi:ABC-type transport system involved in cytochrome c biogenesis permease subunit
MGDVQRIFYFHVASAWVGFLGFAVTFVAGNPVPGPRSSEVRPAGACLCKWG